MFWNVARLKNKGKRLFFWSMELYFSHLPQQVCIIGGRLVRGWSKHARLYETLLAAALSMMLCDVRRSKGARYFT